MKKQYFLFTLLLLCFTGFRSMASIVYVDSSHTGGIQNGASWATAFSDFQSGINAANAGDSLWVAKGIYKPALNTSFTLKDSITILGGFLNTDNALIQRNYLANLSVLNGNGSRVITNDSNGVTTATLLDGFTVQSGTAKLGGGMYNYYAAPTIRNCIFQNNSCVTNSSITDVKGGGIYFDHAPVVIANCTFSFNTLTGNTGSFPTTEGGAIYAYYTPVTITGCSFSSNSCGGLNDNSGGALFMYFCNSSVSNCTFTNNNAHLNGGGASVSEGGAIMATGYSTNISQCSFSNNSVYGSSINYGGAVRIVVGDVTIGQCTFNNNSTSGASVYNRGGALYNVANSNVSQCTFNNNSSKLGGAVYNESVTTIFDQCNFSNNKTINGGTGGAAIYNFSSPLNVQSGKVSNCSFVGNKAIGAQGGAIYNSGISAGYVISSCTFRADTAKTGAGIYNSNSSPAVINTVFSQNIADSAGAALFNLSTSFPKLINCSIVRNKAIYSGSGIYNAPGAASIISNTILWGNYSGIFNAATATVQAKYSLIQDMPADPASFLLAGSTNPLFTDTSGIGNYQLQTTSPCIDAGRNDSLPAGITTDLAAHARIYGGTVDMGAYEYGLFAPVINLGNDTTFCAGNTLTLNAQNSGASYLWSTGATTQSIAVSTSGTYSVTITNLIGSATDTIIVTVNPVPVVNLGNDTSICSGKTLTLNAQNAGSAYLWSNAALTQSINVSTAGTYYVTVTNAAQCKGRDTLQVAVLPSPVINLGVDVAICPGNTVALNAQNVGAAYLWNDNSTGQILNVSAAGTYYVTVTSSNSCKKADTIQVSMAPLPVVNLGNDTSICAGNTIGLNAQNAGATYLWSNTASSQSIDVDASGTYYVTVTNTYLCSNSDTMVLTVLPLPVVDLGNDTSFCTGNPLILDAQNPALTWLWNTGDTEQTLTVNTSGSYSVVVTDAAQCSGSDTIDVTVNLLPLVNLGDDIITAEGSSVTLNAGNPGATYLWSTGATTQTIVVSTGGVYSVQVTNANGCSSSDTIKVQVQAVGIDELSPGDTGITISPNPATTFVYINTYEPTLLHTTAKLFDPYGRMVKTVSLESSRQALSLSGLASGIYVLKVGHAQMKLVKE